MLVTTVGTVKRGFETEAQLHRHRPAHRPVRQRAVPLRRLHRCRQDAASAVAVTPAGQIIMAGYENLAPSSFGVERLGASGTPDTTFGNGGGVTTGFPGGG